MRNQYFSMYQSIKYKECFYQAHQENAYKMNFAYTFVMTALSIGSVLIWSIAKSMSALWAVVIATAQFAQALNSMLPWSKQLAALKYLLPELTRLSLDISHDWLALNSEGFSDTKIRKLISTYENRYSALEGQFTADVHFYRAPFILKKAEIEQRKYFYLHYPVIKELEKEDTVNVR